MRYTPYIVVGGSRRREIALTFDDGPGPFTLRVLRSLRRLRTPATFFQVGQSIPTFGSAARAELRERYPIGDHTENHVPLAQFGPSGQRGQVLKAAAAIQGYGAPFPRLFRPPFRSFNRTTLALMRRLHMLMVLWTVDPSDYLRPPPATIVRRVLAGARPGAIVLLHDAGGIRTETIAALPRLVHGLRRRGYRLVTIPRLLLDDPPPRGQPLSPPPGPGG
jgi:peptidoglycan/xylan/chitin deacetylase (PgdA/CDA1 family)